MISLQNVSKRFGDVQAVSSITIEIESGQIVGLLGPNGAGKTTTMRMMAGVLPPSNGSIKINAQHFETHEHELKQKIGYLPENNPLYEDMTVEEHLTFWGELKGISGPSLKEAIDFAVESTRISSVYFRIIGELSKGFRQRVGLSQAILSRPEILLLDEPTEGLDPNQRKDIENLLSSLKQDRTVVISSHVLPEVAKLAGRIVIIHNGKVVSDDSPENLVKTAIGERQLEVEILGKKVLSTLRKQDRVLDINKTAKNVYLISYSSDQDIREWLFDIAVDSGWKMLSSSEVGRKLEDVFADLTKEI